MPLHLELLPYYPITYGLLAKCEVKMAGYWPSSFFACLWTETKSRSIKLAKNRTRPISSHLDRTNLVNKGFIIRLLVKFCLRNTAGSHERATWLHLPHSGSQSQPAIWFIFLARGASHILIYLIIWLCLTRTENYQIHEVDWLKSILTAV